MEPSEAIDKGIDQGFSLLKHGLKGDNEHQLRESILLQEDNGGGWICVTGAYGACVGTVGSFSADYQQRKLKKLKEKKNLK